MNQNTNVNLVPRFPFSGNLYFSQYDVGRVATINLVEDGTAYTIPTGATVKIQATKPSGLGFSVDCTYSGNVVTVVSTETMTNEYGRFPCELRIESGDVLLGTTNFTFNVEKSPHPTNTVDGDSGDIINQITVALNNALDDIEDAKEEAIEEISQSGGGITEAVKQALLNCFSHVAWIDDQGQTYYDALEDALYPPANLVSISAAYTQSGTVYETDTLDSLKSDLVVTALWDNQTTTTVTDYTLGGTLTEGTSTITVLYGDKSTTFDVTVTHAVTQYSITNNLTQCVNSNSATVINELTSYSGTLSANSGYAMGTVSITMGGTDITSTAYDSSTGAISIASVTGNIIITAEAVEDVGWISGVAYEPTWEQGNLANDGTITSTSNYYTTDYLPCHGVTAIKYSTNETISGAHNRAYYDENKNFISYASTFYTDVSENQIVVPSTAYYVRFSTRAAEYNAGASLTPYLYETITENTVWESGKIYKTVNNQLGFCYGATTVTMLTDAGLYGIRGYYALYDSAKQRTNSMGNTNNFTRTPFAVDGNYYFSLSATTTDTILVKLS